MGQGWRHLQDGSEKTLSKQQSMNPDLQKALTAIEIAQTAITAIETIYGHAQFCEQCQSFEIAKECRDKLHGFELLNSLENKA